jgi:hypothetical protein
MPSKSKSAELASAKRVAVEQLLAGAPPERRHRAWVVTAHPDHNVVGVGIGRKIKRGKTTKTRCVRIYVER